MVDSQDQSIGETVEQPQDQPEKGAIQSPSKALNMSKFQSRYNHIHNKTEGNRSSQVRKEKMKINLPKGSSNEYNDGIDESIAGGGAGGARAQHHIFQSEMNLDAYSQSFNQKDQMCSSMLMNNEDKGDLSRRVMDSEDDGDGERPDEQSLDGDR